MHKQSSQKAEGNPQTHQNRRTELYVPRILAKNQMKNPAQNTTLFECDSETG